ncbi:MAG: CBS domain-containing protein [Planctomycetota bacterium]
MIVRYWMSKDPIVATEAMDLLQVVNLLRTHGLRRLPVVRGRELCGLISATDLYRFMNPSVFYTASMPAALCDELRERAVHDHMILSPFTCGPNDPLEEVGDQMRREKIGSLPVVREGALEGIITDTDVFAALTLLARWGEEGKRVCFRIPVEEKLEIFYKIMNLCQQHEVDLLTILTHSIQEESAHLVMLRVRGERAGELIENLWKTRYQVLMVE